MTAPAGPTSDVDQSATTSTDVAPRLRPVEAIGGVAGLMALLSVAMHRGLREASADSLLGSLISTEHLTFFYWGQDRLANLVPAIVWPIRDVRVNHLAQVVLLATSWFGLTFQFVHFHATRDHLRTRISWAARIAATVATGVLSMFVLDRVAVYTFVLEQQYALSLALYLGGVALLTPRRRSMATGTALIVLASSLIPPIVLFAPAAVVIRRAHVGRVIAVSAMATVLTAGATTAWGAEFPLSDSYTDISAARFSRGIGHVAAGIAESVDVPIALVCCLGSLLVLVATRDGWRRTAMTSYAIGAAIAITWTALFCANGWVEINQFTFRYFFPVYALGLFVLAAAVSELTALVAGRCALRYASRGVAALLVAVLLVATSTWFASTVARTRIIAVDDGRAIARVASQHGADLVVGDYWRVWPAQFAARMDGHELIAVAFRASAMRPEIVARARASSVDVLCLDLDRPTCLSELTTWTNVSWELIGVRSDDPVVIEVALAVPPR